MLTGTAQEMSPCCNAWGIPRSSIPFAAWRALRSNMGGRSFDGLSRTMKRAHNCVLGSLLSSTYQGERAGLGRLRVGRVKYRYASDVFFPAALLRTVLIALH